MLKFNLSFLLLFVFTSGLFAQEIDFLKDNRPSYYKDISFESRKKPTPLSDFEKKQSAVIVEDHHVMQVSNEDIGNNSFTFTYETIHKRIVLNNDEGVERYNKVYIPMHGVKKLLEIKARAITPSGKIIEFDEKNKKEIENYENYGPFTIFAMEGIEVGSEIEYIYVTKKLSIRGDEFVGSKTLQDDFIKKNVKFELLTPDYLVFKTKVFNGDLEVKRDSIDGGEIARITVELDSIEAFDDEEYSLGDALKLKLQYKLDENTSTKATNLNGYKEIVSSYEESLYHTKEKKIDKKERKAASKLFKKLGLSSLSEKEKVVAIEHYVKTKINVNDGGESRFIHEILKTKSCSKYRATRMMLRLYDFLEIDHQLVVTCSRYDDVFDADFETPNYLTKFLIYFPQFDEFIDPTADAYRLGLIPSQYAYHRGVFLKRISVGGVTSATYEVKDIGGKNSDVNYDNMFLDVNIDEDFENLIVGLSLEANGYSASNIRPYLPYLDAKRRKELLDKKLKVVGEDAVVLDSAVLTNEEMKGYMLNTPLKIKGKVSISSLLEKAGPKYIVKIGQVIGPQVEMYQDTARKYPVENYYNHGYHRVIKFKIPEGYTITNLEDLNMDFYSPKDGKRTMEFTCKYVLEGDVLTITVNEFYEEMHIPIERYEEFRAVINAAADFNKKVLLLEKKK